MVKYSLKVYLALIRRNVVVQRPYEFVLLLYPSPSKSNDHNWTDNDRQRKGFFLTDYKSQCDDEPVSGFQNINVSFNRKYVKIFINIVNNRIF